MRQAGIPDEDKICFLVTIGRGRGGRGWAKYHNILSPISWTACHQSRVPPVQPGTESTTLCELTSCENVSLGLSELYICISNNQHIGCCSQLLSGGAGTCIICRSEGFRASVNTFYPACNHSLVCQYNRQSHFLSQSVKRSLFLDIQYERFFSS